MDSTRPIPSKAMGSLYPCKRGLLSRIAMWSGLKRPAIRALPYDWQGAWEISPDPDSLHAEAEQRAVVEYQLFKVGRRRK